jgi:hypothetical protein
MRQNQQDESQRCLERIVKRTAHLNLSTDVDVAHAAEVFVTATRLAGLLGSGRPSIESALAEFRRMVAALLDIGEGGRYGSFLTDCVRDTNTVASIIQDLQADQHLRNRPHRIDSKVDYHIEISDEASYLVESRARGSMRVPESDYLAAVKAFSGEATKDFKFDAILAKFEANGGQAVASQYPLRVVLRFWRSFDPPLIAKNNARYRMIASGFDEFGRLATAAWVKANDRRLSTQRA